MRHIEALRRAEAEQARARQRRARRRQAGSEEAADTVARQAERGVRFEDPYWDDAFCSYYDPTLGTCCGR